MHPSRARLLSLLLVVTTAVMLVVPSLPSSSASVADPGISGRRATGGGLLVSESADRSSPMHLDGATVAADEMFVYYAVDADPYTDEGARVIEFSLDGKRTAREWVAPFDLAGTARDGSAIAFDVTDLDPGTHTIEARVRRWGKSPVLTATFVVAGGTGADGTTTTTTTPTTTTPPTTEAPTTTQAPTTTTQPRAASALMVSSSGDRSSAWDLDGSVLSTDQAFVFWALGGDADDGSGVEHVDFEMNGEHVRREIQAPYDFSGAANSGVAHPLSLTDLGAGTHTAKAKVRFADGTTRTDTASFSVPQQTTTTTTEPPATPDSTGSALTWAPPTLVNPTTINVSTTPNTIFLEDGKDYRIKMPSSPVTKAMAIRGGRNVVLIGGEIAIPWQGSNPGISQRRGLLIRDQTGVVHVEGLLIHGDDLSEGIQIHAEHATVQLQNVRIMNVHARDQQNFSDNHPDVLQPYGGVADLRVDRLTGETDYQGLFLAEDLNPIGRVDLRRVNILSTDTARYLLWAGDYPLSVHEVYADPAPDRSWNTTVWRDHWGDAKRGVPAGGDFVKAGTVGIGYVSPGYAG